MRNLFASLLFTIGCSSAYADQVAVPMQPGPRIAIDVAPAKIRAPYDVQVIRENGETLPTYASRDRFYVQGTSGERYTIKISNPTAHRVEAVVSVDGLDAIDGETGDIHKRGYIVPAYGDVHIEGFRTSLADVATFRFSSVDGSYAGQKGKARNVGVIAVALFEEEAAVEQQIVTPIPDQPYNWTDDLDARREAPTTTGTNHGTMPHRFDRKNADKDVARGEAKAAKKKAPPADYERSEATSSGRDSGGGMPSGAVASRPPSPSPVSPRHHIQADDDGDEDGGYYQPPTTQQAPPTNRPGLGTEYGESRYSAASYTRFVRSQARPIAIAELRYNDAAGLMALGIPVQPMPDSGEIMLRETADPFPGDHFSRPAR